MSDTDRGVGGSFALLGPALIWLFASLKLHHRGPPRRHQHPFCSDEGPRIPLAGVSAVEVATIRPIGDFGGWGGVGE